MLIFSRQPEAITLTLTHILEGHNKEKIQQWSREGCSVLPLLLNKTNTPGSISFCRCEFALAAKRTCLPAQIIGRYSTVWCDASAICLQFIYDCVGLHI